MGSKAEIETNCTSLQLQLNSLPNLKSMQHYSGALTPLHTAASVPFRWEQEPGKPLPCLTLTLQSSHHNDIKCLDLPPRLLNEVKFTKTASTTTVLEGPYYLGRSILGSSSFRFLRKRQKSFDGTLSFTGSGGSTNVVVSETKYKGQGLFGSLKKKEGGNFDCMSETNEGSFVISCFSDGGSGKGCDGGVTVKVERVRRKRRRFSQAKSLFWVKSI